MHGRLPGIVEFADLGHFIDAPIRTYSSGMRARLGFSIATAVDPDVLIIDEVLATGDAVFREKSKARIVEMTSNAKGIVIVTHDMGWVTEFCNRALLLDKGTIVAIGDPAEVVALHEERLGPRPRGPRGRAPGSARRGHLAAGGRSSSTSSP